MPSNELMVSHGGYDNGDVNKDINCMFPIDRIHELAAEGFIGSVAPVHIDLWVVVEPTKIKKEQSEIARILKKKRGRRFTYSR